MNTLMKHVPTLKLLCFVLSVTILLINQLAKATISYTVTDLGDFTPNAINDDGDVAGSAALDGNTQAAIYNGSSMSYLGTLGGAGSGAYGLNDLGEVVGSSQTNSNNTDAFLYDGSTVADLGTLGGNFSIASDINIQGQIVGWSYTASGAMHGFLTTNGTMMNDLGTLGGPSSYASAINDAGMVAGDSDSPSGHHAFLYAGGTMSDLGTLGGANSYSAAINSSGYVVGYSSTTGNRDTHAFLYSGGSMTDLGVLPGGADSYGQGINNESDVVGYAGIGEQNHAFIYTNGAMQDLNTLVPANSGWTFNQATRINNLGTIIGIGTYNGQGRGFLLTPSLVKSTAVQAPAPQFTVPPSANIGQLELFNPNDDQFNLPLADIGRDEPTIVITHGWNDSPASWTAFASEIHTESDCSVNIVAWDWSNAASGAVPSWVAGQAPAQGIALATALTSVLGGAAYDDSIQFIGHSLGTLVNAQAIDQFRVYDPTDLKIQDTLFDDAEIATGGTISAIPSVPVAWIDNYVSAFGNIHPTAANVILQGGPTDVLPANFHSYPQEWYQNTMGVMFSPQFGFQASITQGNLSGSEPTSNSYYIQNGNGISLSTISGGEVAAESILGLRDAVEGVNTTPSFIGYLLANAIDGPIQTYNQCAAAIVPVTSPSLGVCEGIQVTLTKQLNGAASSGYAASAIKNDSDTATSSSSSYAWIPITVPAIAQYISLDFICSGLGPTDFFSMGVDDTPLYEAEDEDVVDGIATNTGFLDVSQWDGEDVQLVLGLNAGDDNNQGGTIVIQDIEFATVPEPSAGFGLCSICVGLIGRFRRSLIVP